MKLYIPLLAFAGLFFGCSKSEPEAIALNTDNCDYCKMTIADLRFASELITEKGKVFKFDDAACLLNYGKENNVSKDAQWYVTNFTTPTQFIDVKTAWFAQGEEVSSPMGGNMAAFASQKDAEAYAQSKTVTLVRWNDIR